MFIKKIQIENYRSCLKTMFELEPRLSILIGPNASGKTNILSAILLLKKLAYEDHYHFRYKDEEPTGQCNLKVWFEIEGRKVILNSIIDMYTDEENHDVIVSSKQRWYLKEFTGSAKRIDFPLALAMEMMAEKERGRDLSRVFMLYYRIYGRKLKNFPSDHKTIKVLGDIARYVSNMKYYSASQFTNPSDCPVSFEIEKGDHLRRMTRLHKHSKFLFDLFSEYKMAPRARYDKFFDIIGPRGIGLIDNIEFQEITTSSVDYSVKSGGGIQKRKREKHLIIPKFKVDKHKLSPNQLSEGTFKTITLLFYLITETGSILLIEEPEVCVHHGLLSSIMELIKTYSHDKQMVVSTHSDFVLDKVEPENVYKVSRTAKEGTKVDHISNIISKKEFVALKNYLDTEGNLGEYWIHGALE